MRPDSATPLGQMADGQSIHRKGQIHVGLTVVDLCVRRTVHNHRRPDLLDIALDCLVITDIESAVTHGEYFVRKLLERPGEVASEHSGSACDQPTHGESLVDCDGAGSGWCHLRTFSELTN